jgi:D-lactate dehydrogenase
VRIAVFSTKRYDRQALEAANEFHGHDVTYFEARLTPETAALAAGFEAVCPFVNDQLSADVIERLAADGLRLLALRSAGFNHVDLAAAARRGVTVTRVPAYSPHAVAELAAGLVLTLNRKLHRAYNRVREGNFALDGLLGFDLHGRTVGVLGTGRIGAVFCRIMIGFGCRVLASDPYSSDELQDAGVVYTDTGKVFAEADIIALHMPLMPDTHHIINDAAVQRMKQGVMLINTSRGGLVDTRAVIDGLKRGRIGALGLDVYEEEADLFFEDLSDTVIQDDVFARLLTFPNVLITGHQGFFTGEALQNIAETTLGSVTAFERGTGELHEVTLDRVRGPA